MKGFKQLYNVFLLFISAFYRLYVCYALIVGLFDEVFHFYNYPFLWFDYVIVKRICGAGARPAIQLYR